MAASSVTRLQIICKLCAPILEDEGGNVSGKKKKKSIGLFGQDEECSSTERHTAVAFKLCGKKTQCLVFDFVSLVSGWERKDDNNNLTSPLTFSAAISHG